MIDRIAVQRALDNSPAYQQFVADSIAGKLPRAHVVHGFLLPTNMTIIGAEPYVVYDEAMVDRTYPHRGERVVGKRAEGSKWYEGRWYSPLHMRTSKRGTPAWLAQSHGLDHDPTEVAASPTQADLDRLVRELMESISEANLLRRELHAVREQVTEMYTRNEALAGETHNLRLKLKHCEQVNLKLQQLVQQYRDEALIHPRTAATINQAIAQLQRALRGE